VAQRRRPRIEKVLVFVLFLLLLAAAASSVHRDEISLLVAFNKLKPAAPFSNASSPGSPDCSLPANWAALPDRVAAADSGKNVCVNPLT
jgi:hypothetical protein